MDHEGSGINSLLVDCQKLMSSTGNCSCGITEYAPNVEISPLRPEVKTPFSKFYFTASIDMSV